MIHQFLHRKPISLEMFSFLFTDTHTTYPRREREREKREKDTHIHRRAEDKEIVKRMARKLNREEKETRAKLKWKDGANKRK